jgi:uncharacterized membrane protein YfcA
MAVDLFSDPAFLVAAIVAVVLLGLAKGGFSGLGSLATPLLALTVAPTRAAAIILPILLVQDVVSVWNFRREWDGWIVAWMLPGAVVGIGIGYGFAAALPVEAVMAVLGGITLAFGGWRLWIERGGRIVAASRSPGWVGSLYGVATGFTSQIAHAGGPPFQMWVTPRRLPHVVYVGTSSILFALINWVKVPAYYALGEFDRQNLGTAALLMPLAIASTLAGVWLVRRVDAARFYRIVYLLMIVLGAKLITDAVR